MRMKSHIFGFALLSATAIIASAPAQAQNGSLTRSFVSSTGVDSNPCTITQPCQSFAQAYTKVAVNGIIAALDPGKYGPLAITGPVTINGNGWAAITGPSGADAIDITAASGNVTLTGLELDGAGAGLHGIFLTSALTGSATLNIRDCVASNFVDSGIAIQPTASSAQSMSLLITNTFSLNNGQGIRLAPTDSAFVQGAITGSTVANNNNNGFYIEGNSPITIATSVAINNSEYGIYENLVVGSLFVRDTIATANGPADFDAASNGAAIIFLYHNMFSIFNGNSATLQSDGTNQIYVLDGNAPTKVSGY
jgi:hypothetical protein